MSVCWISFYCYKILQENLTYNLIICLNITCRAKGPFPPKTHNTRPVKELVYVYKIICFNDYKQWKHLVANDSVYSLCFNIWVRIQQKKARFTPVWVTLAEHYSAFFPKRAHILNVLGFSVIFKIYVFYKPQARLKTGPILNDWHILLAGGEKMQHSLFKIFPNCC